MKLPVLKEFEYDRTGSFRRGDPYTVSMVYARNGESFCLKGGINDVENFLEKMYNHVSYVVFHNYYHHGESRQNVKVHLVGGRYMAFISRHVEKIPHEKVYEWDLDYRAVHRGNEIVVYDQTVGNIFNRRGSQIFTKLIKRAPRCFPKELLPYCGELR